MVLFSSRSAAAAADLASSLILFSLLYRSCSIDKTCVEYPAPENDGFEKLYVSSEAVAQELNSSKIDF